MEIDIFPVVAHDTTLPHAFEVMTSWNRSAMVVRHGRRHAFVDAAAVVIAMAEQTASSLTPLMQRVPLELLRLSELGPSGATLDLRGAVGGELQAYLDRAEPPYVLLAVTASRALVASRHEDLMPTQAAPKNCYCTMDRKDVSPGVTGDDCPHDVRHAGTVRCR